MSTAQTETTHSRTDINTSIIARQLHTANQRLHADCQQCELATMCDDKHLNPDLIHIKRGEHIFRHDDQATNLYSIRQGAVKISRSRLAGEEQILAFYFSGNVFGFDGLTNKQRKNHAIALEDCTLCRKPLLPYTSDKNTANTFSKILKLQNQDTLKFQEHIILVNSSSASTRVAAFLLDVASHYLSKHSNTIIFPLPMCRYDIASHLGLTQETISRRLSKLEQDGIISLENKRKTVRILDLEQLQKIAYF